MTLVRCAWLLAMGWAVGAYGQGKRGSLTEDFSKLSANERARIAARETDEAAKDTAYQGLMQRAEQSFQDRRYEEALDGFRKARELRPYNVYPKVKIEDLEALIAKQQEARPAQGQPEPASPPPSPAPPSTTEVAPLPTKPASQQTLAPPPPAPKSVEAPPRAPATIPAQPTRQQSIRQVPEDRPPTIGERMYKEGGAVVIERTVEDDGRPTVYKKVMHPWGQVFFFKDGLAISQQQWDTRFTP